MHSKSTSILIVLALCVISISRAQLLQAFAKMNSADQQAASVLLPSPETARLVSLGYDQLLADLYWLQFIGYIGDTEARSRDRYALADRYIDLITALDPHFTQAYWFAAFTIGGDEGRPKRAAEIIQRGILTEPNNWYLPYIAGVNQYLFAKDEHAAARYYRMAAKFAGAPEWLERQAEILESDLPAFFKEANSWLNIYNSADEARVKEQARNRCIFYWVTIYRKAPSDKIRMRAAQVLANLGFDVSAIHPDRTSGFPENVTVPQLP